MLISENWLRQIIDTSLSREQLCQELTRLGLEIGTVEAVSKGFGDSVVVGRIDHIEPHPDADRLRICRIDVGEEKPLQIVTNSPIVLTGMHVPVARIGAELKTLTIKPSKLRGVESEGMLCGAEELGLGDYIEGVLPLDDQATVGTSIDQVLDLNDAQLEVELTPNRGDCLGLRGIARDLGALESVKYDEQPIAPVAPEIDEQKQIVLKWPEACPRYYGRVIRNVDMRRKTPLWMMEVLRRSGLRPINAVVDVTNYVMLLLGQPMHAFDLEKIDGDIQVRPADEGETLQLLDDSEVTLGAEHLVIADQRHAIALAGIMGGKGSAISDDSQHVYLEAAYFSPDYMAGKARSFGMHTDAAHRYERGVDYELPAIAMELATYWLLEIVGGQPGPLHHNDITAQLPTRTPIRFDLKRIERVLGITCSTAEVDEMLQNLGMAVAQAGADVLMVTPPSWRFDVTGSHDLVEEVARVAGYDSIGMNMPEVSVAKGAFKEAEISQYSLSQRLVARGYSEVMTYSFVAPELEQLVSTQVGHIPLQNPISDQLSVMRTSLWPGLIQAAQANINRQIDQVKLFEYGSIYFKKDNLIIENKMISGVVSAANSATPHWSGAQKKTDFFDVKDDVLVLFPKQCRDAIMFHAESHKALHPGQSARIEFQGQAIGFLGTLHPQLADKFDLPHNTYLFDLAVELLLIDTVPHYQKASRFPAMVRDLSLTFAKETPANAIISEIYSLSGELLENLEVFDIYTGEHIEKNEKSLSFRFTFRSNNDSLLAEDIDTILQRVIAGLAEQFAAKLRQA